MSTIEITCVVNLHKEGCLAHRTLRSVDRAITHANLVGLTTEFLIVCDKPSTSTRQMLSQYWRHVNTIYVDLGDLGLARNVGVQAAKGIYVAFVDGDDLISQNWLAEALKFGETEEHSIMHPEINVVFDQTHLIVFHPNQPDGTFRNGTLAFENFWSALSCARRSTYLAIPYAAHPLESGFGYEDWCFNCEAIAAGYRHRAVPKTAHFIRAKKSGSLSQKAAEKGVVLRHNKLFDNSDFYRLGPQISKVNICT